MYQQYVHQRFGVGVEPYDKLNGCLIDKIIYRDGYLDVVSKYIEYKGFRDAIDYYIETHNHYFYKRNDGTYGVKGDDETILTDKDFTIHQRFYTGSGSISLQPTLAMHWSSLMSSLIWAMLPLEQSMKCRRKRWLTLSSKSMVR